MKLVYNVGAAVSLMFIFVGLFWMWKLGLIGSGLSICILGLVSGTTLSLGLYVFQLGRRLESLETHFQERP